MECAWYCSLSCQKNGWLVHRKFCTKNPDLHKSLTVEIECTMTEAPKNVVRIHEFSGLPGPLVDVLIKNLVVAFEEGDNEYCMELYMQILIIWQKLPVLISMRVETTEVNTAWEEFARIERNMVTGKKFNVDDATWMLQFMACEPSVPQERVIETLISIAVRLHNNGFHEMALLTIVRAQKAYDGFIYYSRQRRSKSLGRTQDDIPQLMRIKRQHAVSMAHIGGSTRGMKKIESSMRRYKKFVAWKLERDRLKQHMDRIEEAQRTCQHCGEGNDSEIPCCRCGEASYCNDECQAAHWPLHRHNCAFQSTRNWEKVSRRVIVVERWHRFLEGISSPLLRSRYIECDLERCS
jgi:hypothetical protein